MTPTGDADIQVDGTTIHTVLGIAVENFGTTLPALHDKMKCSLRNHLSDLKVIIIDEISMVSNELLFYVHLRLNEIYGSVNNDPFAGTTVIVLRYLLKLPPVGERPAYACYKNNWQKFDLLWRHFKVFKLTEVMRQRGDDTLIDLLINVRVARPQPRDLTLLQLKTFSTAGRDFHHESLHIFAENAFVNVHKQKMLEAINDEMCVIPPIDILRKSITSQKIIEALDQNETDTGGLASVIKIKVNSRVMLTIIVDLSDRLVNGQLVTIKHIPKNLNDEVTKIYIKFDDAGAGKRKLIKTLLQSSILRYQQKNLKLILN